MYSLTKQDEVRYLYCPVCYRNIAQCVIEIFACVRYRNISLSYNKQNSVSVGVPIEVNHRV